MLNFDHAADQVYHQLRQDCPNLAKRRLEKDVKIAAIAIAHQAVVITRNRRDFEQVPGLQIEDWSSTIVIASHSGTLLSQVSKSAIESSSLDHRPFKT